MAVETLYTGDGSQTTFAIGFPYIGNDDVKASINGADTSAFTIPNATQLTFNSAPANGAAVRIYRQTDISNLTAVFSAGGSWRGVDLNDNFYQMLYLNEETRAIAIQAFTGEIPDGSITGAKLDPNSLYAVPG